MAPPKKSTLEGLPEPLKEGEFNDLFKRIVKTRTWRERMPLWKTYFESLLYIRDDLQMEIELQARSLDAMAEDMQKKKKADILEKKIRVIRLEYEFLQGKEVGLHQIETKFASKMAITQRSTEFPCLM